MGDLGVVAGTFLIGIGFGGFVAWLARRNAAVEAEARVTSLAGAIGRLTHDVRGALSPALLMAERLERHDDPAVRQAADVIAKGMDRAASICREGSTLAKRTASGE